MNSRIKALDLALRAHDKCLYSQESHRGRIDVYRRSAFMCSPPHYIFSLTEDWTPNTPPRNWGIEVVVNRVKAHDLWRDDNYINAMFKANEKVDESNERALSNSIESFLYDFRRQFAKATDGINTSSLKKLYRKENSHGYCEPRSGRVGAAGSR